MGDAPRPEEDRFRHMDKNERIKKRLEVIFRIFWVTPIDWLIDWMEGSLCWAFVEWSIDWLMWCFIDSSFDWLIDWLIHRLIDWLIDSSIDWLIDWLHFLKCLAFLSFLCVGWTRRIGGQYGWGPFDAGGSSPAGKCAGRSGQVQDAAGHSQGQHEASRGSVRKFVMKKKNPADYLFHFWQLK